MTQRILIATDGSELSNKAINAGLGLARALGAHVVGVTAVAAYPYDGVGEFSPEHYNQLQQKPIADGNSRLSQFEQAAKRAGVSCEVRLKEDDQPHRAILNVARAENCDLIVMASHGRRGVSAVVLGSETERVLTHADRPVLVVR